MLKWRVLKARHTIEEWANRMEKVMEWGWPGPEDEYMTREWLELTSKSMSWNGGRAEGQV